MRNILYISKVCLMALIMVAVPACTRDDDGNDGGSNGGGSGDYVDLGLTSGTKWKAFNEKNPADEEYAFFTYDEAIAAFGDKLPSREQCEELVNECSWTWTGKGYNVVGPNGNGISFPALGYCDCVGSVLCVESYGYYWSSTPYGAYKAWRLYFHSDGVYVKSHYRCCGRSVRLVQK